MVNDDIYTYSMLSGDADFVAGLAAESHLAKSRKSSTGTRSRGCLVSKNGYSATQPGKLYRPARSGKRGLRMSEKHDRRMWHVIVLELVFLVCTACAVLGYLFYERIPCV